MARLEKTRTGLTFEETGDCSRVVIEYFAAALVLCKTGMNSMERSVVQFARSQGSQTNFATGFLDRIFGS